MVLFSVLTFVYWSYYLSGGRVKTRKTRKTMKTEITIKNIFPVLRSLNPACPLGLHTFYTFYSFYTFLVITPRTKNSRKIWLSTTGNIIHRWKPSGSPWRRHPSGCKPWRDFRHASPSNKCRLGSLEPWLVCAPLSRR
jgi:hypothetical protein